MDPDAWDAFVRDCGGSFLGNWRVIRANQFLSRVRVFDFFTSDDLDRESLLAAFPFLREGTVLQERPNTLTVLSSSGGAAASSVQVSFFGGIGFGRVGRPDITDDGHLLVASLDDLMATKLKVLLQRVESKDYRDVDAMIRAGVSLARGLASARALRSATRSSPSLCTSSADMPVVVA